MSGCATASLRGIQPNLEKIDIPKLNQEQQAELGDTIVSKGTLYTYQGMKLLNEVHSKGDFKTTFLYGSVVTIPQGDLIVQCEDSNWTYFSSKDFTVGGAPFQAVGGLRISKKNSSVEVFLLAGSHPYTKGPPEPTPNYQLKKIRAIDKASFQQELLYNGKVGNSVKFMYRELSNDVMRPAFSQEIQYDLNESKTIGFKGVRIEVVEATNTYLKYKILKSFPDVV